MPTLWSLARLVVIGATAIMACGRADVTIPCPLLACESGVTIHLSSAPNGPFRIDITPLSPISVVYSIDCNAAARCGQDVFFPGLVADRFTITVTVGSTTQKTDVTAEHTSFRPNGPNCPPDCRKATVSARVPA